ncbi:hypothetical protein GIB67_023026 [Kingdonia uniflora]|uniref:Uncharacterized protein n=1 Tax=Kingdonia uniflora TaxID=39325 RepID=A0A7J7P2J0_9MAGN|nr:hypothetical protein GIB67_023026 [Kingdonia uniflora]
MSSTASFCAIYFFVKYLALFTLVLVTMSSIASFLVFMSGGDGSSMRASSEPPTTQWKEYRPRGLQAVRGGLIPIQFDDVGQPIGPNRKFLCTFIGETTRENISPLVGDWRDLEEEDKEYIWKVVAEKGRPKGSVKRSEIFLACHTKEDGTYPEEMNERMERMNRAIQKNPMLMDKDLDNDAVAVEYGADGNGHVRGYNGHLNKTNIRVSTPLKEGY